MEIQPFHPKGDQSWVFTRRTDVEAETPVLWPPNAKCWFTGKEPWCWERLRAGGEGDDRGWDGWMVSPTQWTWFWVASGSCDGQGSLVCCSPWGCEGSDMTEQLNWTELNLPENGNSERKEAFRGWSTVSPKVMIPNIFFPRSFPIFPGLLVGWKWFRYCYLLTFPRNTQGLSWWLRW